MKLLLENWREFLNEGDSEEIDELSQMMDFSVEETIAQHIMIGEWARAWNHFYGWYIEGKVDLDFLIETLDRLLRDEYKRVRKNMINTNWDETMRSVNNFILGLAHGGPAGQYPLFHSKFNLRVYEPRIRMPWEENPKEMLRNELETTLLRKRIKIREKPDEAPT